MTIGAVSGGTPKAVDRQWQIEFPHLERPLVLDDMNLATAAHGVYLMSIYNSMFLENKT